MTSVLVLEEYSNIGGSEVTEQLAQADVSKLFSMDSQQRLDLALLFFIRGRDRAAIREICSALKLTTLSKKPSNLFVVANIFGALEYRDLATTCLREALHQIASNKTPPSGLKESIEEKIKLISSGRPLPDCNGLRIFRERYRNEQSLIERFEVALSTKEAKERNGYAFSLIRYFNRSLILSKRLEAVGMMRISLIDREIDMRELIKGLVENPVSAIFYHDIIKPEQINDNFKILAYGLSINVSELAIPQTDEEITASLQLLRGSNKGDSQGSRYASIFIFSLQKKFIESLISFRSGENNLALCMLDRIINGCLAFNTFRHLTVEKSKRLDTDSLSRMGTTSTTIGASSCCYLLACLLRKFDHSSRYQSLKEEKATILKARNSLTTFRNVAEVLHIPMDFNGIQIALGRVNELIAIADSQEVCAGSKVLRKLNNIQLRAMIICYLDALKGCKMDDPIRPLLYDKIIWGVLVHGGLGIKEFWVLRYLRDRAYLQSDCCLISYEDSVRFNEDLYLLAEGLTKGFYAVSDKLYQQREQITINKVSLEDTYKTAIPECFFDNDMNMIYAKEYLNEYGKGIRLGVSTSQDITRGILRNVSKSKVRKSKEFSKKVIDGLTIEKMEAKDVSGNLTRFLDTYYRISPKEEINAASNGEANEVPKEPSSGLSNVPSNEHLQ